MAFERRTRDGLGVACLALVALLAAGGAAAAPGAILLGAPGALVVAAALAAAVVAWRLFPDQGSLALGLLPFVVGLPLAPWVPGIAAWSGPPLFAPLLGILLLFSWQGLATPLARRLLFPVLLVVFGLAALRVQEQVGPEGDEPHYLMVAESLLRDRDLSLEQDYAERRYEAFYRKGTLAPHFRVRGARGEVYSLHALGLSLLLLPAYAAGGYAAASLLMALLSALLVRELRSLVEAWLGEAGTANAVAWLVGLSPPLLHYAGLIFTEVPAALLLALALRLAHDPARLRGRRLVALAAAIAFLPWLNVRYAALSVLVLLYAVSKRPSVPVQLTLAACALAAALALGVYHHALYGFFDPRLVYGARPELALAQLSEGLPGLLLDEEFGLLVYAPIWVLALPGLVRLVRTRAREGILALLVMFSIALLAGSWHMWRGGWNPPARFLVPAVPVLAVGLALALRNGLPAAAALLAGWSLWTGLFGAAEPRLVHRDRDGTAPFFRAHAGAEEWTRLLPGYVLADDDRHRLAALWAAALAAATAAALKAPRTSLRSVTLTSVAAVVCAGGASLLSQSGTGGRQAVHVIGRPALELPRARAFGISPARWGVSSLPWGPAYEPHRHPEGAALAERLDLPGGRYRLTLQADALGSTLPDLLVVHDGRPAVPAAAPFVAGSAGLEAAFEVGGGGPVTLRLRGGSALIVKELWLEASTFGGSPGLIK
jgi:hypothetical protein